MASRHLTIVLVIVFQWAWISEALFWWFWYWLGNVIEYIKYCFCSLLGGSEVSQTDENWGPNRLKILENRRPGVSWTRLGSFLGSWRPLARISLLKLGPKWAKLAPSRQQKAPKVTQDGDLSLNIACFTVILARFWTYFDAWIEYRKVWKTLGF